MPNFHVKSSFCNYPDSGFPKMGGYPYIINLNGIFHERFTLQLLGIIHLSPYSMNPTCNSLKTKASFLRMNSTTTICCAFAGQVGYGFPWFSPCFSAGKAHKFINIMLHMAMAILGYVDFLEPTEVTEVGGGWGVKICIRYQACEIPMEQSLDHHLGGQECRPTES